jgi:excinuclease ABC subunit A
LGSRQEIDPDLLIPDPSVSLIDGAIIDTAWDGPKEDGGYYWQMLEAVAKQYHIDLEAPVETIPEEKLDKILYGTGGKELTVEFIGRNGRQTSFKASFEGVINNMERRYRETSSEYIKSKIAEFMTDQPCQTCGGDRLRTEALAVTIDGHNIIEVTKWPVHRSLAWIEHLSDDTSPFTEREGMISERILKEIRARLGFLVNVGLDYLTLHRSAGSLSGGEAQRIRLATQIGSRLMGVLYVLDEPSIGLHPRDNDRLLSTLEGMRDQGNTVLVVEHDEETMRRADWIVDMGLGAGDHGGEVVAEGPPEVIINHPVSLTGAYLSGRKFVPIPEKRRNGTGKHLILKGARENNLKNITLDIPLGKFVSITGVSGSGKSSLLIDTLYRALVKQLHRARTFPGDFDALEGVEYLDKIINIDQSPIGTTPRSNPGTYTGVFDYVRDLFAELPESKMRGYKKGRFSFNVKGGRCEACAGHGQLKIEMQFLPDVYVPCDVCHGSRYNRETLQIQFKGKTIADILDMTIDTAAEFFEAFPKITHRLKTLQDVGLGYIRIGQPATTLSGGEAQRVKLSKELSRRSTGSTLYVLDEPSVGLHAADVHRLIEVLQRFVDEGNTVVIIEHNLDIIKVSDWVIDLGPEGGDAGGEIIATGQPEEICEMPQSYTGQFMKKILDCDKARME